MDNIRHLEGKIALHNIDLMDTVAVYDVIRKVRPDRIFHLAAQSFVPFSYENPLVTMDVNIKGTINLLEAVISCSLDPLIHICSSSEVYGNPIETPMNEDHPLRPISPYGVSKATQDLLGYQYWQTYGLRIVRTRAFTHTGARQHHDLVCASIAKQITSHAKVIKLGNLDSIRTICDVKDIMRAYWLVDKPGEVYNVGGDTSLTIRQIAGMMMAKVKREMPIEIDPALLRPTDVTLQIPDCSRIYADYGWKPEIPISKTFHDLLWYYHDYYENTTTN